MGRTPAHYRERVGAGGSHQGLRAAMRDLMSAPVSAHVGTERFSKIRWFGGAVWLAALVGWCVRFEPPLKTGPLFLWLIALMAVACVGNPLGWAKGMLIDWLPLYVILATYRVVWGLVDELGVRPHLDPQHAFDTTVFGERGATDVLLGWLWKGSPRFYDWFAWFVYLSHFWLTLSVAAVLWIAQRPAFLAFRRRVVTTWLAALGVFLVYPTIPPWMAADQGHLPAMVRVLHEVRHTAFGGAATQGPDDASAVVDGRLDLYNPVAAVPSLHSAMPALLLVFLWPRVSRRWRAALLCYPILMGLVLVYTGDHYVFDVLAGWLLAIGVHLGWNRLERGRPPERARSEHDAGTRDAAADSASSDASSASLARR